MDEAPEYEKVETKEIYLEVEEETKQQRVFQYEVRQKSPGTKKRLSSYLTQTKSEKKTVRSKKGSMKDDPTAKEASAGRFRLKGMHKASL